MRAALFILASAMLVTSVARADLEPPVIEHTPVPTGPYGGSISIVATVTDDSEIFAPTLSYRVVGDRRWKTTTLASAGGRYVGQLKVSGDLEYWLEAYDAFGNGPALHGSPNKPHRLSAIVPMVTDTAAEQQPQQTPVATDTTPPVIVHVPVEEAKQGQPTTFTATITDETGVFAPTLYYRADGATAYSSAALVGDDGVYSATLTLRPPFDYWMEAYDEFGNGPAVSASAEAPHRVRDATPAPEPAPEPDPTPPPKPLATLEPRVLEPAVADDAFMRRQSPFKWWMGGAAGVVVAAAVGGIVYALATDDGHGQWLVTQPRRR